MKRFILGLLLLLLVLLRPCAASPPNILLILADDMGWGDVHAHGNAQIDTPALDRLKAESVTVERFFVSPLCAPTRASLLSGRHHLRLRVLSTTAGLEVVHGSELLLPEVLKKAGYATGCFGKWHNGSNYPSDARGQGFDEFLGFSGGYTSNYFSAELEHNGKPQQTQGFITDALAQAAADFIRKHKEQPWFCYVPFNACHSPMQAPEALYQKYSGRGYSAKDAAVYAMVENLDTNVGKLLAGLPEPDNTIVLFTTDNGPNTQRYNGGMRGIKGSVHEGGTRVPCFIRWPGKLKAGKSIHRIMQHMDVMPTLLDLAGIPCPSQRDGISMVPLLKGEAKSWPERMLFDVCGQVGTEGAAIRKHPGTVRTQQYRWVTDGQGRAQVFDMTGRVAQPVQDQAVETRLRRAYEAWFTAATADTGGKVQRFPIVLTTQGTELLAPNATLHGAARFFGHGWDNDWATGFTSQEDAVSWDLEVPEPVRLKVSLRYCTAQAGGLIRVNVADQSVEAEVPVHDPKPISRPEKVPRWEVPEKEFAELELGPLQIPAGKQRLRVSSPKGATGLEISSVRLQ